jgi:hypothetical protein
MNRYELIRQFRVIQHKEDEFEVVIAAEPRYVDSIRGDLLAKLEGCFPRHQLRFQITTVDHLEPDPSGKLRMLVSKVN